VTVVRPVLVDHLGLVVTDPDGQTVAVHAT
jgi:hypothetical protein